MTGKLFRQENNAVLYSVIIPCYKSSASIRKVVEETMREFREMALGDVEFVLVDDCSPDQGATVNELRRLVHDYPNVTAVELAANSGQHNAQMAGLNYVRGDLILSMDDDGQTRPSQIRYLLSELEKGYDVVFAYYPHKEHSKGRNLGSRFNQWSLRILIDKPKDLRVSSFWVIRRFVRDYAVMYHSPDTRMSGLFLRITRNVSCVQVEHFRRESGKSGYTLKKLIRLWMAIMAFSIVPLQLAAAAGMITSIASFIGIIAVIVRKLVRPSTAIGWPSTVAAVFFFSGVILLFLGLIGSYLGRIYLQMTNTPQFVVRQVDEHRYWEHRGDGNEP